MKIERGGQELPLGENEQGQTVSLQDRSLWKSFQEGDLSAYALLYRKYFFVLFRYGRKISQDEDLVRDCVQDLFVKIWNNRERLSDTTSVKYYLFTSLRNKLLDHLRSNQHRLESPLSQFTDTVLDEVSVPDLGEDFRKDKVLKAMNSLTQHQQELLRLKFSEERTNKEIADELGITIQSVYNAVFKTLRIIRKQVLLILMTILFL